MEFQLNFFKFWKMMLWKWCTQYASKFAKLSSGHRTGKGQFSFHSQERQCQKYSNYFIIALISHTSKVMFKIHQAGLKILQASLQQYVNCDVPDVPADFRKGRGTRDHIANICWIIEKAKETSRKTSISASLTRPKPLTVWITTNCGKFWKRLEYQTIWPAPEKSVCRSGSNS